MEDFYDITPLLLLWDSHNYMNALLMMWAMLNFSNHAWSINEDFIKLAVYNLLEHGMSTVMLISSRGDAA